MDCTGCGPIRQQVPPSFLTSSLVHIAAAEDDPVFAVENEWFNAVLVELAAEIGGIASQLAGKIGSRDVLFAERFDGGLIDHPPAF